MGMLAEAYWGGDATHANAAYGKMVLDAVAEKLDLSPDKPRTHEPAELIA